MFIASGGAAVKLFLSSPGAELIQSNSLLHLWNGISWLLATTLQLCVEKYPCTHRMPNKQNHPPALGSETQGVRPRTFKIM